MAISREPTVYDVAKKAGVSIATVSRVLNSPELVKTETRRKVLFAIDELQFVPRADASARARKLVGRIGILTPFFTFPSFVQRMRGVATALVNSPFELVIYPVDSSDRLEGYLAMLPITRRLDGLILMALPMDDAIADRLLANRLETVLIEVDHPAFTRIVIDDFYGGELAAEHLIKKGHQRAAFMGPGELPDYSLHPEDKRFSGYRAVFEKAGLSLPNEYYRCTALTHPDVHNELALWMNLPEPPTAVFTASDDLAIRLLRAARVSGLDVPKDLAIIGFDDIDMAEQIGLTTISQSLDESGRLAVELLLDRLESPSRPVQHIQLGLRLIERETA
jgi:LacI family transcriptional regulator